MDLYMEDDLSSDVHTAQLSQGMVSMASACPALRTLISRGPLSTGFLQRLGQNCPHLSFISIHAEPEDVPYMHRTVPLLPSLLPHITSLSFPYLGGPGSELPDLTQHSHITTLKITSFTFEAVGHWRRLPPNLQYLKCCKILAVPAASFGGARRVLGSLLTLGTRVHVMPLEDLNQLLRAAPVLQELSTTGGENFLIECPLDSSSMAFDLSFLHQRMQAGTRMNGILRVEGSQGRAGGAASQALLISQLPRMTLVKRCSFTGVSHADLRCLLSMFPNVEELVLDSFRGMSDAQLLDLAACVHITTMLLEFSSRVSPQGLVALCQRLPALRRFRCGGCTQLRRAALAGCAQLLAQQSGRIVQMEDLST